MSKVHTLPSFAAPGISPRAAMSCKVRADKPVIRAAPEVRHRSVTPTDADVEDVRPVIALR